jgi:hypothetical protein
MMNMATKGKENIAESNRLIERLDKNEAEQLVKDQEFIEAKNIYEQAFMGFLSAKFTDEFLMSKNGEEASQILLDTTKKLMDKVNYAAREKQRKFDRLMEALEKNPELAKQLEINT